MFNRRKFVKTTELVPVAERLSIILLAEGVFGPAQAAEAKVEAEKFVATAVESADEPHGLELAYEPSNVRVRARYCKPFGSNDMKFLQVRVSAHTGTNKKLNLNRINQILELNY